MSRFRATGLTVQFKTPIWYPEVRDIPCDSELSAYGHEIAVDGGYKSATIKISANIHEIEEWIENGLGRDVVAYSPEGIKIWEGFANEIMGSFGSVQVKRGPLMNVGNRVSVVYTPYVDITGVEPTTGETTETVIAEDLESQEEYGILETIVNGGTLMDDATYCGDGCVPDNEAEELRDAYLNECKYPETTHTIGDSGGDVSLTLNCLGYNEWLTKYVYNIESDLTIQIPYKIIAVLVADPNAIFSTDYTYISTAAAYLLLTSELENQNKTAKAIIDELLAQGDANDNRTIFGIYNDRKAYFSAIPNEIEYYYDMYSRDRHIYTASGGIIQPWYIRPGKWLFLNDFMAGRTINTALRLDPRNVFIESVRYDAPYSIQMTGSKISTVKQLMAKRGIAGA